MKKLTKNSTSNDQSFTESTALDVSARDKSSKQNVSMEEQVVLLRKELYLEKDLTKILLKQQKEWSKYVESLAPTIEVLSGKIKALQNDLHLKNQELSNVLQSLSSGLIVTDLKGKILTFNRAAVAITGIEKEDALSGQLNHLVRFKVLPEPLDENSLENVSQNYHQQFVFQRSSDEEIIIESSTTLMESEEKEKQGIIINLRDITELKRLEEEAERTNRLTAMGEIAMQVAHEIRNPLGSIELFVSMMKMDLPENSNEMDLAWHISSAAKSMNHIISNILEYTKPRPVILDKVDIHFLLKGFVEFARFSAEQQGIKIKMDFSAEDYKITGNSELIKQVFHNIFVNACQAMPEGGTLQISTKSQEEVDPVILKRFNKNFILDKQSLPLIKVSFSDTGKGMRKEVRKKIFDPFFTTREKGTGLGMSIIHNTMESHGGTILVDSTLNKGTKISLLFQLLRENSS